MFLSIVWQQGFKIVLAIGALLFVGFNVYAMTHYDLRHFAGCPRAFYFVNGFLIGIAITSAFLLWAISKQDKRTQVYRSSPERFAEATPPKWEDAHTEHIHGNAEVDNSWR